MGVRSACGEGMRQAAGSTRRSPILAVSVSDAAEPLRRAQAPIRACS